MSHLTGTTATGAVQALGVGVPGYAHPLLAPVEWAELTRPGTPCTGPCSTSRTGRAAAPTRTAWRRPGSSATPGSGSSGTWTRPTAPRPFGELVTDAHRFLDWYKVDGYYLDRCPADRADLAGVRRVCATLETVLGGEAHLVLGHGTHPTPDTPRPPTSS